MRFIGLHHMEKFSKVLQAAREGLTDNFVNFRKFVGKKIRHFSFNFCVYFCGSNMAGIYSSSDRYQISRELSRVRKLISHVVVT